MWVRFKDVARDALGAQLPNRLAAARHHPAYGAAIARVPRPPVASELTWPNAVLAVIAGALWLAALAGAAARLAVIGTLWCVAVAGWQWADFVIKSRGRVRRQLYVVLDKRALRIASYARYTMTLWNPAVRAFEITASRQLYQRCEVGEVGLAVFRGRHLRELTRLAPDGCPAPRLRGVRSRLHPAAAGAAPRFDERTGVS
jgi:hypothetical protein